MSAPKVRKILCHSNEHHPDAQRAQEAFVTEGVQAGYQVVEGTEAYRGEHPDLIVLLGGDGFLMESMRALEYPSTPVFGINFGSVGFLMNQKDCLHKLVSMIREWTFLEEEHAVLEARLRLEDGTEAHTLAFNDFVIERMTRQSVRLQVFLDDVAFNHYVGDGFVLATAAGSTAYNLAAGGPVVHPALPGIVITPLYPHRASPFHSVQFSLLVPLTSRLRIVADDLPKRGMRVVSDGRELERVSSAEILDSGRKIKLLRPRDHIFVETLGRKFIGEA
jgi:NAD+ kinase